MTTNTTIYGIRKPSGTDPADVPTIAGALADDVDAALAGAVLTTALGVIGGTRYTGSGNFANGLGTTELALNMSSGAVVLAANRRYHIKVKMQILWGTTPQAAIFHVRDTNVSGTQRGEFVPDAANTGSGHTLQWYADYETSSAETKTFVVTGKTTTGSINVTGGGASNPMWVLVEDVGPAGKVTGSASP